MRPQTIGRVLGMGVRVAGRMANERLSGQRQSQTTPPHPLATPVTPDSSRGSVRESGRRSGSLSRGAAGFFKPFTRVGGIVFLEVTGTFFLLFVLIFGQMAWRMRSSYAAGADHWKFLAAIAFALLFVYLSVSSFWRARKR
jgi:hypothetical protein